MIRKLAAVLAASLPLGWAVHRLARFEIAEESMSPALQPGDCVLAVRRPRRLRTGDVVVFEHPERPAFTLVKRVTQLAAGTVATGGDNRARTNDVGPIPVDDVEARVVAIYWPPRRAGAVPR